jgi:hypothetical protein
MNGENGHERIFFLRIPFLPFPSLLALSWTWIPSVYPFRCVRIFRLLFTVINFFFCIDLHPPKNLFLNSIGVPSNLLFLHSSIADKILGNRACNVRLNPSILSFSHHYALLSSGAHIFHIFLWSNHHYYNFFFDSFLLSCEKLFCVCCVVVCFVLFEKLDAHWSKEPNCLRRRTKLNCEKCWKKKRSRAGEPKSNGKWVRVSVAGGRRLVMLLKWSVLLSLRYSGALRIYLDWEASTKNRVGND